MRNSFHNTLRTSTSLAVIEFNLKNEGSFLGVFWYLLDPILMFFILIFIRGQFNSDIENYPLYLIIGLVVFNFFQKTTKSVINTVTRNSNQRIIKSIILNKNVFILSSFIESLFSHLLEWLIILGFMIYFKSNLLFLLIYPIVLIFLIFFVLGVSFLLASLAIYVKDVANIWSILTRLLWFATPIFYSSKISLPFDFHSFNPIYHFISLTRQILIQNHFPGQVQMITLIGISLVILAAGWFVFRRHAYTMVERV